MEKNLGEETGKEGGGVKGDESDRGGGKRRRGGELVEEEEKEQTKWQGQRENGSQWPTLFYCTDS